MKYFLTKTNKYVILIIAIETVVFVCPKLAMSRTENINHIFYSRPKVAFLLGIKMERNALGQFKKGVHYSLATEFKKGVVPKTCFKKGNVPWIKGTAVLVEKTCLSCEKVFFISGWRNKKGEGKYCSHKCRPPWNKGKKGLQVAWNKGKKGCMPIPWNKGETFPELSGENSPVWKGGEIEKKCKICDKVFLTRQSAMKWGRGKFCSHRCNAIHQTKHNKKKDTSIEVLIEKELINRKIQYEKQASVKGIALVDFLLDDKIIIQCDGYYWHNKPGAQEKDFKQDCVLEIKGYSVYRFWDYEINKSAKQCIDVIVKGNRFWAGNVRKYLGETE